LSNLAADTALTPLEDQGSILKTAEDKRTIITLDAGGTNFSFSAIQGNREIIPSINLPAQADTLEQCLETIVRGFRQVMDNCPSRPSAISFAFPGPADYPLGIIGDLANLPVFRGGVPLGPLLESEFGLPVYINNDGDLFTYGEAIAGILPQVNDQLKKAGSPRRFKNLLGITLGTGFGAGIYSRGELFTGDNSAAAEIWGTSNVLDPRNSAEEGVSIRAVRRVYAKQAGIPIEQCPEPKDIFGIFSQEQTGNKKAAEQAFNSLGTVAGNAIANALVMVDGLVVIGGGLAGAHTAFMPYLMEQLNLETTTPVGIRKRLDATAYNLEAENDLQMFLKGDVKTVGIPGTSETMVWDPLKRFGVGITRLGTNRAVAIGAYAYALKQLGQQ